MAKNPLKLAHKSALDMNDKIGDLFAEAGTLAHPHGFVLTAYRNARRAMVTALAESDPLVAAKDVYEGLRKSIRSGGQSLFIDAQSLGMEESARQLRFYGIQSKPLPNHNDRMTLAASLDAIIARIDAQDITTRAMILTGAEPGEIVGDDERQGILKPSEVAAFVALWAATLAGWSFSNWTNSNAGANQFSKQVIAALDERTTDCCLQAHGQIQAMDKPFHLTGSPRYADYMDWSPFHTYCRTSIALYQSAFDDGLTAEMRAGANAISAERTAGGSGYRNPANAYG